jgi:isopenicillin-N epimerase
VPRAGLTARRVSRIGSHHTATLWWPFAAVSAYRTGGPDGAATRDREARRQGTRDPSAYLTVPYAIEWQQSHEWHRVRERCHQLARRAADTLGLIPVVPGSRHGLYGQMVSLQLPDDAPADLQERLFDEHRIEIPVMDRVSPRLIRTSFQGYNDGTDLERLRAALDALL